MIDFFGCLVRWSRFPSLSKCLVLAAIALSLPGVISPAASLYPEPDPSRQSERDWVDSRWSKTDVGPFLASTLDLPGGRIAKGLSIKVGEHDEGTVAFDTGACTLRAGWIGGFLQFNGARFG